MDALHIKASKTGALSLFLLLSTGSAESQQGADGGSWQAFAADLGSTKYSPLEQIDSGNVERLQIAWRRPALDAYYKNLNPEQRIRDYYGAAPLVIDGVAYIPNGVGLVEAFDPGTGETLWVQKPVGGVKDLPGRATRGVAYWSYDDESRILVQRGTFLYSLHSGTGELDTSFGDSGRVNLQWQDDRAERFFWGGVPFVIRDVVIIGQSTTDTFIDKEAYRGDVRAFDVSTGKLRWQYKTIPQKGEFGTETWHGESWSYTGHTNVWALFSGDEDLGLVYMPITSPTNDMYGGHRLGDNLFGQTLVAVDVETGERVWHYQTVHHGLWDYDLPAAPILMDITVDGRPIKAVAQITKQGFTFVFDRATGDPVWDIEERPVPKSSVPGEETSPTQPFPTRPLAFDRRGSTEDNLIDFTPELRAEAIEITKRYVTGPIYTPPSIRGNDPGDTQGTIQLPGSQGGADIQGASFDPDTGILYVPSITAPFVADLLPGDPDFENLRYVAGTRRWIGGPRGLPLFKPPYGRITAIDMNTGDHVWMVPNGDGPRDHPAIRHLNTGPLGVPGRPTPLLTKTLLFIGEGLSKLPRESRVPPGMPIDIVTNAGGNKFRAYDKNTGETLWEVALDAGTSGPPITYMFEGRQFIVVAIGDLTHSPELIAFSLPEEDSD